MAQSGQKFISKNRAPRVQVEYDVELYGAEKKVNLPFVMGVMSDLAGKSEVAAAERPDDDFSPDKVAENIDGVKELLEARKQLSNLLSYMDGKSGAEELLNKLLKDEALLKALASKAKEPAAEEEKKEE